MRDRLDGLPGGGAGVDPLQDVDHAAQRRSCPRPGSRPAGGGRSRPCRWPRPRARRPRARAAASAPRAPPRPRPTAAVSVGHRRTTKTRPRAGGRPGSCRHRLASPGRARSTTAPGRAAVLAADRDAGAGHELGVGRRVPPRQPARLAHQPVQPLEARRPAPRRAPAASSRPGSRRPHRRPARPRARTARRCGCSHSSCLGRPRPDPDDVGAARRRSARRCAAFSSSDSARKGGEMAPGDDAPGVALDAAARSRRASTSGVDPNRKWRRPASCPASITSGIRSGPGDAARAAAAEAAHQPRHGRAVGEVQPRPAQRAHHRVAVLRGDDAVHAAQARVAAAAAANAAQHRSQSPPAGRRRSTRRRAPCTSPRLWERVQSARMSSSLTTPSSPPRAASRATTCCSIHAYVRTSPSSSEISRLPAKHLAQARVVGVAPAHALGAVDEHLLDRHAGDLGHEVGQVGDR